MSNFLNGSLSIGAGSLLLNKRGGASYFGEPFVLQSVPATISFGLAAFISLSIPIVANTLAISPGTQIMGVWNIGFASPTPPYSPDPVTSDITVTNLYADGTVTKPIVFNGNGPMPTPFSGYWLNPYRITCGTASLSHYTITARYSVPVCTITVTPL